MTADPITELGLRDHPRFRARAGAGAIESVNPATGKPIGAIALDDRAALQQQLAEAVETFRIWRMVPAPQRGLVVRAIGDELRAHKNALGRLVSMEVGKILPEGLGEVQETIDIADFAVGLSRQLGGPTLPSERDQHRMFEQWHPLGPIGVITAFNFPNAVWGWNAMLAAVCGDVVIWKPSLLAPLTALASNMIADRVATEMGYPGVFRLIIGTDDEIGESLIADRRLPLISATGSCRMGRRVGAVVAQRLGRCLLELGGNNAAIVDATADLDLALKSCVFGAVGTAGQRCTTTRRLLLHESIADDFLERMIAAYRTIRIGDPLEEGVLVGPVIGQRAVDDYLAAIEQARAQGGEVLVGGSVARPSGADGNPLGGWFVEPTIVRAPAGGLAIAREETFAPILYTFTYNDLDDALARHNEVDQGLSSAMFTNDLRASERFLGPAGSDCGIANINSGTSGAEIGGAFGGEKDTGGGRESGSDSWKAYMRRQTCSINSGTELRLAQGIRFE
ncbi:MAG: aldehyde dehydrogenase family protein [Phycisphaerales bacterium JB039]